MRARWLAVAVLLAGCTGPTYPTSPTAEPPARAAPPAPPPEPERQATPIPPPRTVTRECGAKDLQGLVGRPRSEAPVPIYPSRQRVACTTCPAAEDVDPGRLTVLFDAQTGLIKQVRCG